jgi:hypothetical protein
MNPRFRKESGVLSFSKIVLVLVLQHIQIARPSCERLGF